MGEREVGLRSDVCTAFRHFIEIPADSNGKLALALRSAVATGVRSQAPSAALNRAADFAPPNPYLTEPRRHSPPDGGHRAASFSNITLCTRRRLFGTPLTSFGGTRTAAVFGGHSLRYRARRSSIYCDIRTKP